MARIVSRRQAGPQIAPDGTAQRDARLFSDDALALALLVDGLPIRQRKRLHGLVVRMAGIPAPRIVAPSWTHVDGRHTAERRLEANLRFLPADEAAAAEAQAEARDAIARLSALPRIDYETARSAAFLFNGLYGAEWHLVSRQNEITRLGGKLEARKRTELAEGAAKVIPLFRGPPLR
jgi:hypothetical protein